MILCLVSFHVHRFIFRYIDDSHSNLVGNKIETATGSVESSRDDEYEYEYVGDISGDTLDFQTVNEKKAANANAGYDSNYRQEQELKLNELMHPTKGEHEKKSTNRTMAALPTFNLSESSEWDAFGILEKLKRNNRYDIDRVSNNRNAKNDSESFWQAAQSMRVRFSELYGGENAARMLLDRGMTTFSGISIANGSNENIDTASIHVRKPAQSDPPSDVIATACRLYNAKTENRSFRMAFGGYSVTTGRGNKHQDSYPFQLQDLLKPILKAAGFVSPLSVINAAIGGVPSFPYGWCMTEFWGGQKTTQDAGNIIGIPDVVSWDFGMNEASGGPEGLEAYIRHLIYTYSISEAQLIPPKLIVKDYYTASHRKEILSEYSSILKDPVVLHTDYAVETMFEATKVTSGSGDDQDLRRPFGFRNWRKFGAPPGAPGQAPHHPAVQEHKLNAWILAMHFVTALEYMIAMEDYENAGSSSHHWCPTPLHQDGSIQTLPPPVSRKIVNNTKLPYDGIFFGHPLGAENIESYSTGVKHENSSSQSWTMNPMHCRTTFEPKVSGDLSEIVVSGTMGEDLDPTLPKSQYYYNRGWTYDLSEAEKTAKRKLNLYPDGLGFKDSKEAYYGIYESPHMTLLLPYQSDTSTSAAASLSSLMPQVGDPAKDWYESIVLCQVNDKNTFDSAFADPNSCNFGNDVGLRIGGIDVPQNTTKMLNTIGSVYLGKPICKHVLIPPQARLTSHNTLMRVRDVGVQDPSSLRGFMAADGLLDIDQAGLLVELFVSNPHIVRVNQACSLSHVVWEERRSTRFQPSEFQIAQTVKKD